MSKASGKFVLRISEEAHLALQKLSLQRGLSLNELCKNKVMELIERKPTLGTAQSRGTIWADAVRVYFSKLVGAVLFGSVARQEHTSHSDLDLLLVLPEGIQPSRDLYDEWDRFVSEQRQSFPILKSVSPHFVSLPQNVSEVGSLWFEVSVEGQVLWEKEGRVSARLFQIRSKIAEGEVVRHYSHGHPYWVRRSADEK